MKKLIVSIFTLTLLAACKPEEYTGPLDSPIGNWEGVKTDYYFNGEMVAEVEGCEYSAISFYKDGFCCIEGVKGAFPYSYDHARYALYIDNTFWAVHTLTGAELIMEYIETIFGNQEELPETAEVEQPEQPDETAKPDKNGIILPAEYKGVTINADANGYYYETSEKEIIYCNFRGSRDESGSMLIDFWYDHHIDYFIPLVVED